MEEIIGTSTLNDQVYNVLREKILKKELPPGSRMVASKLADEYGISKTPIRDAIRKLVEDGLVSSHSTRGYYVYTPTKKDISEIFEIRKILDVSAAKIVITRILPEHPEALKELRAELEESMNTEDPRDDRYVKNDEKFHVALVKLTQNEKLLKYYCDLQDQTKLFRFLFSKDDERMKTANTYHRKIFESLEERDMEKTVQLIEEHIEYSRDEAIKILVES